MFRALAGRRVVSVYKCNFDAEAGLKTIRRKIGAPYDYGGLLWFGWVVLCWRVFRRKVKKPWKNTRGQFCSELVARMFHAADLPDTDWDFEMVSPEDLRVYCNGHPVQFEQEEPEKLAELAA